VDGDGRSLAAEFESVWDADHGAYRYVNNVTQLSQWENPDFNSSSQEAKKEEKNSLPSLKQKKSKKTKLR
jgi:hypothetical protein